MEEEFDPPVPAVGQGHEFDGQVEAIGEEDHGGVGLSDARFRLDDDDSHRSWERLAVRAEAQSLEQMGVEDAGGLAE